MHYSQQTIEVPYSYNSSSATGVILERYPSAESIIKNTNHTVAILGTGIDQEVVGDRLIAFRDFIGKNHSIADDEYTDPIDKEGFGTKIASIIAGNPPGSAFYENKKVMGNIEPTNILVSNFTSYYGFSLSLTLDWGLPGLDHPGSAIFVEIKNIDDSQTYGNRNAPPNFQGFMELQYLLPAGSYIVTIGNIIDGVGEPFTLLIDQPYLNDPTIDVQYQNHRQDAGINPDIKVVSLKVLDDSGIGTVESLTDALKWIEDFQTIFNIRIVLIPFNISMIWSNIKAEIQTIFSKGAITVTPYGTLDGNIIQVENTRKATNDEKAFKEDGGVTTSCTCHGYPVYFKGYTEMMAGISVATSVFAGKLSLIWNSLEKNHYLTNTPYDSTIVGFILNKIMIGNDNISHLIKEINDIHPVGRIVNSRDLVFIHANPIADRYMLYEQTKNVTFYETTDGGMQKAEIIIDHMQHNLTRAYIGPRSYIASINGSMDYSLQIQGNNIIQVPTTLYTSLTHYQVDFNSTLDNECILNGVNIGRITPNTVIDLAFGNNNITITAWDNEQLSHTQVNITISRKTLAIRLDTSLINGDILGDNANITVLSNITSGYLSIAMNNTNLVKNYLMSGNISILLNTKYIRPGKYEMIIRLRDTYGNGNMLNYSVTLDSNRYFINQNQTIFTKLANGQIRIYHDNQTLGYQESLLDTITLQTTLITHAGVVNPLIKWNLTDGIYIMKLIFDDGSVNSRKIIVQTNEPVVTLPPEKLDLTITREIQVVLPVNARFTSVDINGTIYGLVFNGVYSYNMSDSDTILGQIVSIQVEFQSLGYYFLYSKIRIEIGDFTQPVLSHPNDITYKLEKNHPDGLYLRWDWIEKYPNFITVRSDDTILYQSSKILKNYVEINLISLPFGIHNITIQLTDKGGNLATDLVVLRLIPSPQIYSGKVEQIPPVIIWMLMMIIAISIVKLYRNGLWEELN